MSRHGKVRVKIDKALIQRQVQSGGKSGTFAMLDHIASVSKDQVPLDMGPLKNSCVVDVAEDGKSFTFKPKAKARFHTIRRMRLFSMRIGIFAISEAERPSIWKTPSMIRACRGKRWPCWRTQWAKTLEDEARESN